MSRDGRQRGGNDPETPQDDDSATTQPEGQTESAALPSPDETQGWNPSERVRLQITLDAETAFKLDSIARRARKPRGVIVAKMISQVCKGYRSPTIPAVTHEGTPHMATRTQPDAASSVAPETDVWQLYGPNLHLTLAPEAIAFLNDLLRDTRESPETLFRNALGLYRLAVDAHCEGKVIGATSRPEGLDDEFAF